jgi:hypothetical protein
MFNAFKISTLKVVPNIKKIIFNVPQEIVNNIRSGASQKNQSMNKIVANKKIWLE